MSNSVLFFLNCSGFSWQYDRYHTNSQTFLDSFFMWLDLSFNFLFWGNLIMMYFVLSLSLRIISLFVWKKLRHIYHFCCTINMVQAVYAKTKLDFLGCFLRLAFFFFNLNKKVFFLNDSFRVFKEKTKNVFHLTLNLCMISVIRF